MEHASICRALAVFGRDVLRLPYFAEPGLRRLSFLLLEPQTQMDDRRLTLGALRVAAAHQVHCRFRRTPSMLRGEATVMRALHQVAKEMVQGHRLATAALDGCWVGVD